MTKNRIALALLVLGLIAALIGTYGQSVSEVLASLAF